MMYNLSIVIVACLIVGIPFLALSFVFKTVRRNRDTILGAYMALFIGAAILGVATTPEPTPEEKAASAAQAAQAAEERRKAADQRAAEEKAKKDAEEAACYADIDCIGKQKMVDALTYCPHEIERMAKFTSEWTNSWAERKFSHYRFKNKKEGIVTYIGDRVRFQNGFGAWQNMKYECDFDTKIGVVVNVRVKPGRI